MKTEGQKAYEEDCRRMPTYDSGKPRKTWDQLERFEQLSWVLNPTPRNWKTSKGN
jgi:hypothetical protein